MGIRDLRDHLSAYLERVKAGETLTITEHGRPIARLVGSARPAWLDDLIASGRATAPTRPMPNWDDVPLGKWEGPGTIQDFIDEVRGR